MKKGQNLGEVTAMPEARIVDFFKGRRPKPREYRPMMNYFEL